MVFYLSFKFLSETCNADDSLNLQKNEEYENDFQRVFFEKVNIYIH